MDDTGDGVPAEPNAQGQEFRCAQCGGKMSFDAAAQHMLCGHCGHTMEVARTDGLQTIVEYDLEHGLAQASQRGYGVAVKTTKCNECGATVSFGENVTSTACEFCGSAQVMQQDANRKTIRPESLVPFHIDNGSAKQSFSGWLNGLWFRPSALKHNAKVSEMNGVYIPYWTFDARVDSDWTAQAGYYYYETEHYTDSDGNSRTRQVRRTRWEPAWGSRRDEYDDLLICASQGLPAKLANKLTTFDTSLLQPYLPEYLAGWKAEEYAVELNDGWKSAVHTMERTQERLCSADVPGDTQRFLNVTNRFYDETFKHVLLPIWIAAYRYNDKVYQFLVNGQTGEVTGKAPYSWVKICALVLLIAAVIAGIVFLVIRHQ